MNPEENYLDTNRDSWNKRTVAHFDSDFYNLNGFLKGESSLNEIELEFLGDIKGKSILHLQCHFGQDTISLARMGAIVTGVDLSDVAIEKAKELALETNCSANFICSDIYDLPKALNAKFDMVFTSYGTIGWLPDINKWAEVVSHFLKPNGQFLIAEFHPVVWMFDDNFEKIKHRYFNSEPISETEEGAYANKEAAITTSNITWNHGLAEVATALIGQNIKIEAFREYDYSPYDCFSNTYEFEPRKFRIKAFEDKVPMVYAMLGRKD